MRLSVIAVEGLSMWEVCSSGEVMIAECDSILPLTLSEEVCIYVSAQTIDVSSYLTADLWASNQQT